MAVIDIYARVSRVDTRKSKEKQRQAVDGQIAVCRAKLLDAGHTVGQVHEDLGKSAWNPNVKRKGWEALMARIESGRTDGMIVFDIARFTRQPEEGQRLIDAAKRGIIVLDSETDYDLMEPDGRKHFRDQLTAAEYESARQATRVARGKRMRALAGHHNGSHRPFGFEKDGVTIREDEADVLRDVAQRFLAGEPQDAIICDLNSRGVLTSYGKPWTRAGLRQVLTRHRNVGIVTYRSVRDRKDQKPAVEVAKLPGNPLLADDDWRMILSVYASRKSGRPPSETYLCSGIVACHCGTTLAGRPRKNMKPYADGDVKREYWCMKQRGGCGGTAIDQRGLDKHVRALAVAILGDPRHADAIESAARKTAERRVELDAQIAKLEILARQLSERLGNGELPLDRYDAATRPLDKRLAALRAQRDQLPASEASGEGLDGRATRAEWERRWDAASTDERRDLVRRALRGRTLVVNPADRTDRTDVGKRVTLAQ